MHGYTVWSRPDCVWCQRAIEFLRGAGEYVTIIKLSPENLDEFMARTEGAKTVPQVFAPSGYKIGGYEALVQYYTELVGYEVNGA